MTTTPQTTIAAKQASINRRRLRATGPFIQTTAQTGAYIINHQGSCNGSPVVGLLRHPPVRVTAATCYGRLDVPLVPGWQGWAMEQAGRLAAIAPARIWSSPASRCLSVADALAGQLGLEVVTDERLLELDFGDWEGLSWEDVPRASLDRWAADPSGFHPPGGESGSELIERVGSFARALTDAARSCAVVSHGGPLRLLPALLRGERIDLLAASPAMGTLTMVRLGMYEATSPRGSA